ncbi:hypothetical protein Pcinc_004536 [Petrolisthes cinctipes]|uniref:SCAN box domain-containing protein n=1 Tax=Petrolisthes cinctipes TaxID=88211 RepID=A0AAE1GGP9_PETCI|nr:hypothetical protein Pcinc_004536 [Petrolisthes cinctipes]
MRQGATTGGVRGTDVSYQFNTPPATSTPVVAMEESHVKGREEREVRQSPDQDIPNTGFLGVLSSEALLQLELKKTGDRESTYGVGGCRVTVFEKKVTLLDWPSEKWSVVLSHVPKGKALEAYERLSVEGARDYETIISHVLRAYELRPEDYRRAFRGARKRPGDTYTFLARYLTDSLEKWLQSEQVNTLDRLKEVVQMEMFIDSADRDMNVWLREKRFPTISEAAVAGGSERKVSQLPRPSQDKGAGGPGVMGHDTQSLKSDKDLVKGGGKKSPSILCFFCKQAGHIRSQL